MAARSLQRSVNNNAPRVPLLLSPPPPPLYTSSKRLARCRVRESERSIE